MNYCWTTLSVKDLDRSIGFYEEIVGLPLNTRFQAGEGKEIAFLGAGNTKVELVSDSSYSGEYGSQGISLGFEVSSLEETIELLKSKGIEIASGPIAPNPSVRFFFAKDPDGITVQFVQKVSTKA